MQSGHSCCFGKGGEAVPTISQSRAGKPDFGGMRCRHRIRRKTENASANEGRVIAYHEALAGRNNGHWAAYRAYEASASVTRTIDGGAWRRTVRPHPPRSALTTTRLLQRSAALRANSPAILGWPCQDSLARGGLPGAFCR